MPEVLRGGLAGLRQVVGDEDGVGRVQAERLERAQVHLAAGGKPDLPVGVHEPEHRRGRAAPAAGRAARPRAPQAACPSIGRRKLTGIDSAPSVPELVGDVDELRVGLAHADDHARAGGDSGGVDGLHGRDPVLVGVGRADRLVVALGGVQIVVVRARPRRFRARGPASSVSRPRQAQIFIGSSALIRRTASSTSRSSRALGPRPLATMQYVLAFDLTAWSRTCHQRVRISSEYLGISAVETRSTGSSSRSPRGRCRSWR